MIPPFPSTETEVDDTMNKVTSPPLRGCHLPDSVSHYLTRGWWRADTVLDLLDGHVRARPDRLALTDPENLPEIAGMTPQSLTWSALDAHIDRVAAVLHNNGIRAGDVIAVLLPNSVALTATYFALWRLGAIAAPMPITYRGHELSRIVEASRAVAVVTTTQHQSRTPHEEALRLVDASSSLRTVFTFGSSAGDNGVPLDRTAPTAELLNEVRAVVAGLARSVNDCITICWTSGTEAAPKGVPRCHGDWLAIGQVVQDGMLNDANSVILGTFPMVNMAGFATSLLPSLLSGAHLVQHHPFELTVFLDQVQRHRITHTSMPPAILSILLQNTELREAADLSSLRAVGSGGAPLPPGVVRDWQHDLGIDVLNFFGSNEGVCLLGAPTDTPDPMIRAEYLPNYSAPGKTWATPVAQRTDVRLVDVSSGEVVTETGGRGELRFRGPTVFAGYLEGTTLKNPFDDEGFLCSGDVFELCGESGTYLKFVDRSKEIIIRGGMNIAPAEIEGLLLEHPNVWDVAVVGYDDAILGEKCCAVVVPAPDSTVTLDELIAFLREKDVASFKLPERLELQEHLPRSPVGKLQRRELRTMITQVG